MVLERPLHHLRTAPVVVAHRDFSCGPVRPVDSLHDQVKGQSTRTTYLGSADPLDPVHRGTVQSVGPDAAFREGGVVAGVADDKETDLDI